MDKNFKKWDLERMKSLKNATQSGQGVLKMDLKCQTLPPPHHPL